MNDLKQLFGSYNICARFAPGFLFITSIYFLLGYDIATLQNNSIVIVVLLTILSGVCGFISASLIKFIEQKMWKIWVNPTISYLKRSKKEIYKDLLNKNKNDDNVITYILKVTRDDNKLFWKNVSYGFFRNSILLSLVCVYFSYPDYFLINICVCIIIILMTFICSFYYVEQAIKTYQEKTYKNKN